VHVAVLVKVARQVFVGLAPALRAGDVDLPSAQSVPQRAQHAQLIRDSFHFPVFVDDRSAPLVGDHAVERHALAWRLEALLARSVDMAAQQLERLHHRPVGAVRAAKLKCREQSREHPPVVVGVGAADRLAHPLLEELLARLGLNTLTSWRKVASETCRERG
jgi:hypothetical protein